MTEFRSVVLAGLAVPGALFATQPAFAQDAVAGFHPYVGVIAGLDHLVARNVSGDNTKNGLVYGGVVGADADIGGGAIVGFEGEVSGETTRKSFYDPFSSDSLRLKSGRDLYIGARAGLHVMPGMIAYAKAGYTNARFRADSVIGGVYNREATNEGGYRLGLGAEWQRGPMRLRTEYRFSDYGDVNLPSLGNTGIGAQRHQIVVGALFGF